MDNSNEHLLLPRIVRHLMLHASFIIGWGVEYLLQNGCAGYGLKKILNIKT
jgi:hypothetical protein